MCLRASLVLVVGCVACTVGPSDHSPGALPDSSVRSDADPQSDSSTGPIVPSTTCAKESTLLCEDFESGSINPALWTFQHETATGNVETSRAARGRYSLHVNIANHNSHPWNFGWLRSNQIFPVANSHFFIRAWVYLDANTPTRHFYVMDVHGTEKSPLGRDWEYFMNVTPTKQVRGGPNVLRAIWNYRKGYGEVQYAEEATPKGQWTCWEWEINGTKNELNFWVDGKPVPSLSITANRQWLAPPQARLNLGLDSPHLDTFGPEGYDAWFDEIAVTADRLGCEK